MANMTLLERIDMALQHARKTRGELANGIGISTQAISNLKRRPGSTLRPENVARAAVFLGCDIYWLCTGEGGKYKPHEARSLIAREVAKWLDEMSEADRNRAFSLIYQMHKGNWPVMPAEDEPALGAVLQRHK
jgi:DNA-binding Xre family transcriptional regulator